MSILKEERQVCRQVSHGAFLGIILCIDEEALVGDAGGVLRTEGIHRRVGLVGRGLNLNGHDLGAAGIS